MSSDSKKTERMNEPCPNCLSFGGNRGCDTCRPLYDGNSKYKRGQTIRETATGDQYTIVIVPVPYARLWSPDQPVYWIRSHGKDTDHFMWAIAKSTLEDQFKADANETQSL